MTEQPPPPRPASQPVSSGPMVNEKIGMVGQGVEIVKGLTLTNVLIIALLLLIAIPAYIIWRALSDESLMDRFLSRYEELTNDKSPCTLRMAHIRGAHPMYSLTTGFAFQGSDRWTVGVIMEKQPSNDELVSYCATLNLIVDYMRRPNAKSPTYPNSDEPLIWKYNPPDDVP